MKHPITKALLALACAGAFATTAKAQLPTSYTQGDYFVGFHQVGGAAFSVVIDLGPISSFTSPLNFTISAGTTLTNQYGSGWATDPTVMFGVAATTTTSNFVTSPSYQTGPNAGPATVFKRLTPSNATTLRNNINAAGTEFMNNQTNGNGDVEPNGDANAYANYMPGGTQDPGHASGNASWGFFSPTVEGAFDQGTSGIHLDLIQLASGGANTPGTDLGYFTISSNGNTLSFTPAGVPEPSTDAAVAFFGALAFFALRKMRNSAARKQIA